MAARMPHSEQHPARPAPLRRTDERGRTLLALLITTALFMAELVGGLLSGSLALLADAAHMATDVVALALVLFSLWFARRPFSHERSYGYHRVEILATLGNGVVLFAAAGYILVEAALRLGTPQVVQSGPMLGIAAAGLAANLFAGLALSSGARHSLTMRGALWHVLSDAVGSVGVILAGLLILLFGWYRADAAIGLGIGLLVLFSSGRLLWPSIHILLEGTPHDVDLLKLRGAILETPGVLEVHDIHAWTLTSGYNAMTAHVVIQDGTPATEREELLDGLRHKLPARFPVGHVTIQLEESSHCCDEDHQPGQTSRSAPTAGNGGEPHS